MIKELAFLSLTAISFVSHARPLAERATTAAPRSQSTTNAKNILSRQEQVFDRLFKAVGYRTYSEFETFLRESNDPVVQKAISLAENENHFEIHMARDERTREGIAQKGFLNQFQTGTSSGVSNLELRTNLESTMIAMDPKEYQKLSNELKPKYLSIKVKDGSAVHSPVMVAPRYGTDVYTFKNHLISDRMTFFPGDSLDHVKGKITSDPLTMNSRSVSPTSVEMLFLPWSRRLLMVPFMLAYLQKNTFGAPIFDSRDYRVPLLWSSIPHPYWEAQVFGPLDLSHVESFEFRKNPPNGKFLSELLRRDILILDGRIQPAKPWVP